MTEAKNASFLGKRRWEEMSRKQQKPIVHEGTKAY